MKRLLKNLIITLMAIIMATAFSACSFIRNNGSAENLPDSAELSKNISIITGDGSLLETTLEEAVKKAEGASVAIYMENSGSAAWGSGTIVNISDGNANPDYYYVLTCHHVIGDGGNITVYAPDQNYRNVGDTDYNYEYAFTGVIDNSIHKNNSVTLVGGDAPSDVAVLKLKTNGKVLDKVNVSSDIKKGQEVFSIGNPSGTLPGTVSRGIVSYLGRTTSISGVGKMTLTQIDVQINHGNSGGGLFNLNGDLVGITNSGSDDYEGLNFAIAPVTSTVDFGEDRGFIFVASQLIASATEDNYGYVSGRWKVGINFSQSFRGNVTISSVVPLSDAETAGLKSGDIITGVQFSGNNYSITSSTEFTTALELMLSTLKIGDTYTFTGYRQNSAKTWDFTVTQYIFCNTGIYPTV